MSNLKYLGKIATDKNLILEEIKSILNSKNCTRWKQFYVDRNKINIISSYLHNNMQQNMRPIYILFSFSDWQKTRKSINI